MTVELELMWQRRRGLESTLGLGHSMHRGLEVGGNGIQVGVRGRSRGGQGRTFTFYPVWNFYPQSHRVVEGIKQEYDMVRLHFEKIWL